MDNIYKEKVEYDWIEKHLSPETVQRFRPGLTGMRTPALCQKEPQLNYNKVFPFIPCEVPSAAVTSIPFTTTHDVSKPAHFVNTQNEDLKGELSEENEVEVTNVLLPLKDNSEEEI